MDTTTKYWKQCIRDYISCMCDFDYVGLTNEQENEVVKRLLDDEELWQEIGNTIDFYISKVRGGQ